MKWVAFILLFAGVRGYSQVVQNFDLTDVTNGNTVSLKNYESNPAVVIIYSTINCPYTEYYLERIKALGESYKGKVPVVLINSSPQENESQAAMAAWAREHKFTFPYLADKNQYVLINLNPRKSPEAFLLQHSSGKFRVVYKGAIDDNAQSPDDVKHEYLRDAIEKALTSQKPEPSDIRPVGCSVIRD